MIFKSGSRPPLDIAYDGTWGYHPLVVSLAEIGEVLRLVNRPGNRPSHEGAATQIDRSILLCLQAGFRRIVLRGDTDFSQTEHLDRWHDLPWVRFVFGYDARPISSKSPRIYRLSAWTPLHCPPRYEGEDEAATTTRRSEGPHRPRTRLRGAETAVGGGRGVRLPADGHVPTRIAWWRSANTFRRRRANKCCSPR